MYLQLEFTLFFTVQPLRSGGPGSVSMSCLSWLSPAIRKEGELGTVCGPQQPRQHLLFEQCLTGGSRHMCDHKWMTASDGFFHPHQMFCGVILTSFIANKLLVVSVSFYISHDSSPTLQL